MIRFGGDPDLTALTGLLEREIAALDRGDSAAALALLPEKRALLDRLEARSAALADEARRNAGLRDRLDRLRALLARNGARVERLRTVAGTLTADLARLRDRHGLGGLYGADGGARSAPVTARSRIDHEV
ncbi:hypothetical protein [Roseivivax sp. CAU 1761]